MRPRRINIRHQYPFIGYGAIGTTLAQMALAFGMRVLVSRKGTTPSQPSAIEMVTPQELMRQSDHVVIAAPATVATRHMVNWPQLQNAKPGLHLVNVARGSLVDQDAFIAALNAGLLSQATVDVTDPEPLPAGHPLYLHPRVRLSPHLSSYHPDLGPKLADAFIDNLRRFVAGETLSNRVDAVPGD